MSIKAQLQEVIDRNLELYNQRGETATLSYFQPYSALQAHEFLLEAPSGDRVWTGEFNRKLDEVEVWLVANGWSLQPAEDAKRPAAAPRWAFAAGAAAAVVGAVTIINFMRGK